MQESGIQTFNPLNQATLSELLELLPYLTQPERAELDQLIATIKGWVPLPGPQTQAIQSEADVLFYGGAAGGGKTDLLLGLASKEHRRSIIFRRESTQLKGIEDRASEMYLNMGRYNGQDGIWRFNDGRRIEFGSCKDPGDERKYQGRAHDLKGFDEITHFLKSQFVYLGGWLRSADPSQRCRVVCTGNPPTDAEGDWVIEYWAPWLDQQHPHPAKPGELRWFTTIAGKDQEVPDGTPIMVDGDLVTPKSRTFIPSRVEDNPYYLATNYKSTLQALPEPLRSKLLKGDFTVGQDDNPWQVIPTEWVKLAQKRWKERRCPEGPMDALGVDVARGGLDRTVLTPRYGTYFAEQRVHAGVETPESKDVIGLIVATRRGNPFINVDEIGVGAAVYDAGKEARLPMVALVSSEKSGLRDKSDRLSFANKRSAWWWKLREALDPDDGEDLALPPDRELMADLCAPRWCLKSKGIQVESKDDIFKRLGRSTDKGDSLVYSFTVEETFFRGVGFEEVGDVA